MKAENHNGSGILTASIQNWTFLQGTYLLINIYNNYYTAIFVANDYD